MAKKLMLMDTSCVCGEDEICVKYINDITNNNSLKYTG